MYRVILADGDDNTRDAIAGKADWHSYGFELAGAYENGRRVLEAMEARPADAIITDIDMPVMDGLELVRQTRERWPRCKTVILTGRDDFNCAQLAVRCRVFEYILKPVAPQQLCELLERLRAELDVQRALGPGGGHALIAADLLSDPDRERAIAELRKMVLRKVKLLDKDGAAGALERFVRALEQPAPNRDSMMARINDLGLRLMEYAAEQGMDIKENICETVSKQLEPGSAHEYLGRYVARLIDESKRLTDKSSRHGALAVEFIKEHYMRPDLSVKDMTALLSVSGSYFSAMFKHHTGATFTEFLARLRMNKAQELLLTTDKKNYEIAAAVGYDDPGYFRQIFKKHTDLSPSEFRRVNAG